MEKTILTIFAIVGLLFITIVAYYIISRLFQQQKNVRKTWPPSPIMEASAAQCPDYWVNIDGLNSNNHRCKNNFDIPLKKSTTSRCRNVKCTDDDSSNTKTFNTLNDWPVKNREDIRDRCLWRDCCGPQENIPASWVGISETCGY